MAMSSINEIEPTYEEIHLKWKIGNIVAGDIYKYFIGVVSSEFAFSSDILYLGLFPENARKIRLGIFSKHHLQHPLQYNFSLIKSNGSVMQLDSGILENDKTFVELTDTAASEIVQEPPDKVPYVVIITCTLKKEIGLQQNTLERNKPWKLIRLDKLSENFEDLFTNKETCDTILKVKEKEYKAHRSVLVARSKVFAANFKHDTLEKQTGVITITDCDPDSFQGFLHYLYTGKLEGLSLNSALNLYYTSDKYDIEELKKFCMEYLLQCLTIENVCEMAVFADKYDETQLFSTVQSFFNDNVWTILETSEWDCLMKEDNSVANKLLKALSKLKLKK